MRRKWRKVKSKEKKFFCSNKQIKAQKVFLIDENGENIGVIPINKALEKAQEIGLDLVEVNPKIDPPVVKILDLGQLKYIRDKKTHKEKVAQKKINMKGIRLSVRISKHDFEFRLKDSIKFLKKGNKLKIELILKGRERQHPEKAIEIINNFTKKLKDNEELKIIEEQSLTKQGRRFSIILMNKLIID